MALINLNEKKILKSFNNNVEWTFSADGEKGNICILKKYDD